MLTPQGLSSGVTALTEGSNFTCGIVSGGAQCWGYNATGALGNNSTTNSYVPVQVSGLTSGVTAIAATNNSACAIVSGAVECWGNNATGQLGNNSTTNSLVPVSVIGLPGTPTQLVGGNQFMCALLSNQSVYCWGYNGNYNLGNGTTSNSLVPGQVTGLGPSSGVIQITAEISSACALFSSGKMECWGSNTYGQLGTGNTTTATTPALVPNISNATAIGAGGYTTCAVVNGGSLECWGYNVYGQLGNGSTTNTTLPAQVIGLTSGVASIAPAGGQDFMCAVLSTGAMQCWGRDTFGQLGINGTYESLTPVVVGPFL